MTGTIRAKIQRKDALLLIIHLAGDTPMGPAQLQMCAFLPGKSGATAPPGEYYDFSSSGHRPFSDQAAADAGELAGEKLVFRVFPPDAGPGRWPGWQEWAISPPGARRARGVMREMRPQDRAHARKLVRWAQGLSLRTLCASVRAAYPEFGVKSGEEAQSGAAQG